MSIQTLLVENKCHLPVNSGKLWIIAIFAEGIGTVDGILIALKGHGGLAVVMVGTAQQIVGQQAVVRRAVVIEELDIGLHIGHREGLVVAVALIDAVEPNAHVLAVGLAGAAGHRHQKGEQKYQILHRPAKIQNYKQLLHLAARLLGIIKI